MSYTALTSGAFERRAGPGRRRSARGGGSGRAPTSEAPQLVPGLKAWFDSRTSAYMTMGTGIASWASRAGSLGSIAKTQATGGNQPAYATAVASLNGQNAVQYDGTDDYLTTNNTNAWTFLHNGTGASVFTVLRMDSTGGATQILRGNSASLAQTGVLMQFQAASVLLRVHNGSGTAANTWTLATAAHYAKDVSRWQMWGYLNDTVHNRVSGSSLTNADTGGQEPSSSNPTAALRLGASTSATNPLKGYIAQEIYYDHVLTAGETSLLAAWAASIYGVSA